MSVNFPQEPVNFSQEVVNQAAELVARLAQIETTVNSTESGQVIDEQAQLYQLNEIDPAQKSYDTMAALFPTIHDLGENALIALRSNLMGIKDTLGRLQLTRDSLIRQVDENFFDNSLSGLMQTSDDVFRRVSSTFTAHDAATEIETTLKDRIAVLAATAKLHQLEQLQGFLKDLEVVHVRYFTEQFQTITARFTGNTNEDFNSLHPLLGSLTNFTLTRNFIDEGHGKSIAELTSQVRDMLQNMIKTQQATEALVNSGSNLKGQILSALDPNDIAALKTLIPQVDADLRGRLFDKINELRLATNERPIPPGAMGMINRGQEAITNCATVSQCKEAVNAVFPSETPQESVAETMKELLTAITMSLNTSRVHSSPSTDLDPDLVETLAAISLSETPNVSATPYSRETLEKKIAVAGFINQMHTLNTEGDSGNLQLMASLIEETDEHSAHAIYALQFWLHHKLGKYVAHDDYGRVAFFGDLPPSKAQANATPAERTEVLNRALVKVLLSGIQEAIRVNDTESLRMQLDQLSEIRLDSSLPGYYAHPNLEHRIRGLLFNAHVNAGFDDSTRQYNDFGKVALRNEEGCNVPAAIKLAAVAHLNDELHESWGG